MTVGIDAGKQSSLGSSLIAEAMILAAYLP
jgi:hypothetical protein